MRWPFHHKKEIRYWLKVFAVYALVEACIQLLFLIIRRISIPEYHLVMLFFQCLLIVPIWWVAWLVSKQNIAIQVLTNVAFYAIYTYIWFNPVQDAIAFVYNHFQELTRPPDDRQVASLDRGGDASFLNYQLLKHAFRLSWFYLASFFYHYRREERQRMELAVSNKELQLRLLKWHLNPSFYFKTISYLQQVAQTKPISTTAPILQLAKVMEYVIYETKEKLIDVKKELNFLANYIQLLNQQPGAYTEFVLSVDGGYNHLKIAPLMLAGFVDGMVADNNKGSKKMVRLQLKFTDRHLFFTADCIDGEKIQPLTNKILTGKINELYPGKYFLEIADEGQLKLKIELDEAG
jgi:hypothetical protein